MKSTILILSLLLAFQLKAEVRLPHFLSDNMVLQRDRELKIWGWGSPKEKVTVTFNGQTKKTKTGSDGKWNVTFDAMPASSQGLEMRVTGKNEIVIKNILIGDVWICSGQSNMEWMVSCSNNFFEELDKAKFPNIRLLTVPKHMEFSPIDSIKPTKWVTAEGNNISDFSAVGYFFGRHIHENHGIPIGLVSSNWGGKNAEAFTSAERLAGFAHTADTLASMKSKTVSVSEVQASDKRKVKEWISANAPKNDRGDTEKWYAPEYDFSDWESMEIPSAIEEQPGLENFDGTIWFKKKFVLTKALSNKDLYLRLGTVHNFETIYINGVKAIENINARTWRSYPVAKEYFKPEAENTITIKLFNPSGVGGLTEDQKHRMNLSVSQWYGTSFDLPLAGVWKYKVSGKLDAPVASDIPTIAKHHPNHYSSSIFNAMIHPFIPMGIKGVIWYQGEANASNFKHAVLYRKVFPNMIQDWRERWGYDFDFYFVQLANFANRQPRCDQPCEQTWAYLRESQQRTLSLPNTGMAVTIDVGAPKDVHPRDKQSVGKRLGLIADAKSYGKQETVYSGPMYKSHEVKGNEIWLSFDHVGSGLQAKNRYGYLEGFQVAGKDKVYHWATARIEGDKVVVTSEHVTQPVAVRYAWENNPEDANLYNAEELPAVPFRTDDWELYQK